MRGPGRTPPRCAATCRRRSRSGRGIWGRTRPRRRRGGPGRSWRTRRPRSSRGTRRRSPAGPAWYSHTSRRSERGTRGGRWAWLAIGGIGRLDGGRLGEDAPQDREAARRGRDQGLGIGAGPQRQHRQVPGRFGALPAGQLVGPEGVDVQPAGALGLFAAQADRAGAVGPGDAAFRRLEPRPAPGRRDGEQAGLALDHHVADVGARSGRSGSRAS